MTSAAVAGAASISERIEARPVWQIQLGAMAAGAVATLGHAPFFFTPAYVAGLVALIFLLDGAMRRPKPASAAFARAWSFAFGHFLTGMYWVGFAFLQVEGAAPFIPLAVSALPAGLALFWGAAGALSTSLWTKDYRRIPVFAAVFGFAEFLRGFIFTGFPWQIPAAIWPAGGAISQTASIVGATGLSVLTLLVLAAALWPSSFGGLGAGPDLGGGFAPSRGQSGARGRPRRARSRSRPFAGAEVVA